jgi:acyl dehydratase
VIGAGDGVQPGQQLPLYDIPRVRASRMRTMAALIDDPVPIHYDVDAVRALGLGDREINQGPMAFGYLVETVAGWTGDPQSVATLRCRFHGNVFAGDHLLCGGEVVSIDPTAGTCVVSLWIHRGDETMVSGDATVRLSGTPDPAKASA